MNSLKLDLLANIITRVAKWESEGGKLFDGDTLTIVYEEINTDVVLTQNDIQRMHEMYVQVVEKPK